MCLTSVKLSKFVVCVSCHKFECEYPAGQTYQATVESLDAKLLEGTIDEDALLLPETIGEKNTDAILLKRGNTKPLPKSSKSPQLVRPKV